MDMSFWAIFLSATAGLITLAVPLLRELRSKKKEPTLQDKITELTNNLASSVAVVSEIEQEILKRKDLVAQQQVDMARYEQLLQVNKDQLEAIAQTLTIPVRKESTKNLWLNVLASLVIAAAFFALGYVFGGK
jgi:hypothetical protein